MRIVFDLQAGQTSSSRHRGIGRYSTLLARAMVEQAGNHEIHIAVNQAFTDTIEDLYRAFPEIVQAGRFRAWRPPAPVSEASADNRWCTRAAELLREAWLREFQPDVVHVCSLFEGYGDDAVTSVPDNADYVTAVTLYDLIPYAHPQQYLSDRPVREWYLRKLASLRKADLLVAISDYSRREASTLLGFDPERIVTVSPAADPCFRRMDVPVAQEQEMRVRFGLKRQFVMYTGGIDHRKNLERLIEAYALLSYETRQQHCLALVCKVTAAERDALLRFAQGRGLSDSEVVITGYVSDRDLVALYNLCTLFVFPSLYEGFGLPVLEAMACGAPVVGSDRSGIPEVVGLREALFDPTSIASISAKIGAALVNQAFRKRLAEHGEHQARRFSWKDSGRRALEAFHDARERRCRVSRPQIVEGNGRMRLAYVSPLPPEQSGIADYSIDLLPELARYYDIDLVTNLPRIGNAYLEDNFRRVPVEEFELRAHRYDRILYHIGNSVFHRHMLPLLERHPGTVVLHDFFLSGLMNLIERTDPMSRAFQQSLYRSHGYSALLTLARNGSESALSFYPCSLSVLEHAQGVIVHSEHSMRLARKWFEIDGNHWVRIAPPKRAPDRILRGPARESLGIPADAFVVCSFGILASNKLSERLLQVWLTSSLARDQNCHLLFVGDGQLSDYGRSLSDTVRSAKGLGRRISFTGYVDRELYHKYLSVADVAVQLRSHSRGETSGAVLDCMAYGVPTIVNSHAALAELPDDPLVKLAEDFSTGQLGEALESLYRDHSRRDRLGQQARQYISIETNPSEIARQYAAAIERFASDHPVATRRDLIVRIAHLPANPRPSDDDLVKVASCLTDHCVRPGPPQLLIDITGLVREEGESNEGGSTQTILSALLEEPPAGYRVEPVCRRGEEYCYARSFALRLLGLNNPFLDDTPVAIQANDVFLQLGQYAGIMEAATFRWFLHYRHRGMKVHFFLRALSRIPVDGYASGKTGVLLEDPILLMGRVADGFVCSSPAAADELRRRLECDLQPSARLPSVTHLESNSDDARQITRIILGPWIELRQQATPANGTRSVGRIANWEQGREQRC